MNTDPLEEIKSLVVGLSGEVTAMRDRFDGLDRRLDGMDGRFDGLDRRLDGMDGRFDGLDRRLDEQARVMQTMSNHLTSRLINFEGRVEERFSALNQQIRTMEMGLLNEIKLQSMRTTRVEERLTRLEGAA